MEGGTSMPMPSSQSHRKEWRMVSEHQVRNDGNEELERSKLEQSDVRTINEVQQGRVLLDEADFCSLQTDGIGGLDDEIMRQKLHNLARKREELQGSEIELRVQMIAKTQIAELHNSFDVQIKEQANAVNKLQEQLFVRDQSIHELERKMEDKERELHSIRLDSEAAWAKEDLLREQNKELTNFRRERDNIEAERVHYIKQIHDLQEHIQDNERRFMELQEQNRIAQEAIIYKDEQLRDAQSWIAQAQEIDALQASANHSLQAELRERMEQYNQLWLFCQRQVAEVERAHMQTVQQLQLDLIGGRNESSSCIDGSHGPKTNLDDVSKFEQNTGNHHEVTGSCVSSENSGGLANGISDYSQSFVSSGNTSTQSDHTHGIKITSESLIGMPSYHPSGQITALHPYVIHQQGLNHAVPVHVAQPHVGFHALPGMSSFQHWQDQPDGPEGQQMSMQNQYLQPQENLSKSDSTYGYEVSVNGPGSHSEYLNVYGSRGMEQSPVISSAEAQAFHSIDKNYMAAPQVQLSLQHISSQFHNALRLKPDGCSGEMKAPENNAVKLTNGLEEQGVNNEQTSSVVSTSPSGKLTHLAYFTEAPINNASDTVMPEALGTTGQLSSQSTGKGLDAAILDERSLLACVVRTIPAGGKIRISSTLPNRLAKMLSPLHWHDYKKNYGKLDDFVASHPELFVIEGDYIQLREGAQGIIAATAAVAKVAAAAASSSPYLSIFSSVAVTPMAQANPPRKVPSMESTPVMHCQNSNGSGFKILSTTQDPAELNGPDVISVQSIMFRPVQNGTHPDRACLNGLRKGSYNSIVDANFSSRQQCRDTVPTLTSGK